MSDEDRREAWIQRRAEWWAARRVERSSEDVWEARTYVGQNVELPVRLCLTTRALAENLFKTTRPHQPLMQCPNPKSHQQRSPPYETARTTVDPTTASIPILAFGRRVFTIPDVSYEYIYL